MAAAMTSLHPAASLQLGRLLQPARRSPHGMLRSQNARNPISSPSAPQQPISPLRSSAFLSSPSRLLSTRRPFPSSTSSRSSSRSKARILTTCQAKSEDVDGIGALGTGAIVSGAVANPVVLWSLYVLKTTGCGLPPGPGGSLGALEGVSYLVILGVIAWSIFTKVKSGSGLPAGPFGLLGAVEGFSYLSLLAIVVVFGLQALEVGSIPGPLPGDQCFG